MNKEAWFNSQIDTLKRATICLEGCAQLLSRTGYGSSPQSPKATLPLGALFVRLSLVKTEHQCLGMADVVVQTDVELVPINWRCDRLAPVHSTSQRVARLGSGSSAASKLPPGLIEFMMYGVLGFANPAATKPVGWGSPQVVVVKIAKSLGCGRNTRLAGLAAAFDVPLLAEEEEHLVLLNRTAE
jgi:hypothetical protein